MATVPAPAVNAADYTTLDQIVAAVAAGKLNVDTASALLARLYFGLYWRVSEFNVASADSRFTPAPQAARRR
ncbi:MAG TPA: hypothetical protein VMV10_14435 [Pirellulales bacterium]|nr:hypothetical protein [Pirellulales bacterium]